MSDKMRWRCSDCNPVMAAVKSETVIEIGDLVWQDIDNAKPASAIADRPNMPEVNRAEFKRLFLGVAMQRSHEGDTSPIRVATTGVFEFDCHCETYELGDLVSIASDQQVVLTKDRDVAIGRTARRSTNLVKSMFVDIRSTVMTGGV